MRLPRSRVRILVAVLAAVFLGRWMLPAAGYLAVAQDYANRASALRAEAKTRTDAADQLRARLAKGFFGHSGPRAAYRVGNREAEYRAAAARSLRNASYCDSMRSKYLRAARSPWRHVEPDPPPPE